MPGKDALRIDHRRTGSPVVTNAERDASFVYRSPNLAHLFQCRGEGFLHVDRLSRLCRQGDDRQTEFLSRGEADDINFGIFDGTLIILANMPRAKNILALGQYRVIQVDAGVQRHPRGLHNIWNVLASRHRAAADHGKVKRRAFVEYLHSGSLATFLDFSPGPRSVRTSGSCCAKYPRRE